MDILKTLKNHKQQMDSFDFETKIQLDQRQVQMIIDALEKDRHISDELADAMLSLEMIEKDVAWEKSLAKYMEAKNERD